MVQNKISNKIDQCFKYFLQTIWEATLKSKYRLLIDPIQTANKMCVEWITLNYILKILYIK